MSTASDLIKRLEKETGQRISSNNGDNLAIAGLMGAMSRLLEQSPDNYTEREDLAAGVIIKHRMSPEELLVSKLESRISPDDLKNLLEQQDK